MLWCHSNHIFTMIGTKWKSDIRLMTSVSQQFYKGPCVCCSQGMKVFFLIVVAFYILYLIFLIVRACSELKNMPYSGITAHLSAFHFICYYDNINLLCCFYLDLRLKFLTALTFVVLVIRCAYGKYRHLNLFSLCWV